MERPLVIEVRSMPATDLVEYTISTYPGCIPKGTKLRFHTRWTFNGSRKSSQSCLKHAFIHIVSHLGWPRRSLSQIQMEISEWCKPSLDLYANTIKSNYPSQRPQPILNDIARKKSGCCFKTDAANGYWCVPPFLQHRCKLEVHTCFGQCTYNRMGRSLTSAVATFSRLKDIATEYIPAPNSEPSLKQAADDVTFDWFMDDESGGASDFDSMLSFLREHYFDITKVLAVYNLSFIA